MSEAELDAAIAERFKAYEDGVRLPGEFKSRFISLMRRRRTLRRARMFGLVCAAAAAGALIVGLAKPAAVNNDTRLALTARAGGTNETEQVSYWVLLGYLRECFSRSRPTRRKEEE